VPRDPEVPARHCDVAGDFLNMLDDGESPSSSSG
jgi:hypothetical protein